MAMNVGNESGEGEVMVEMNTTPLIDVMLVLLTLLIITLPIQTHAVKLDMPKPNAKPPPIPPVGRDAGSRLRRHHPVERHAGRSRDAGRLSRNRPRRDDPQPEIHLQPNRLAKYDAVAKVLADAQRIGVDHIGFTGIEQYSQ